MQVSFVLLYVSVLTEVFSHLGFFLLQHTVYCFGSHTEKLKRTVIADLKKTVLSCTGEMVTKQPLIRSMRTVKRETLKLISGWVSRSNDPQMVSLFSLVHLIMDVFLCVFIFN